ncbi:hypothetical protein F511_35722 [Dorcoceras hygrometricum]|uniref:Uncharacterized protein n=1 Tax=Dorcoceras hygrometricum TaxID=472368 RepID=A0A2Z7BJ37_9LAMI|nr:hypothetical protein F511_35722 [Dorcoceras hygrometricum]
MAPQIVEERESVFSVSENGSGTSGLSTPFGSDLGSSGTSGSEDEEFMAELSRQMAECMLVEDDDHAQDSNTDAASVCEDFEAYQSKDRNQESGIGEMRAKCHKRVPTTGRNYANYRRNGQGICGSGMKAIFLDKSGSNYGSGGTGVFLPRFSNDPTPEKKKPVCSTVLMPMRVLQTLELHFSRLSDSSFPVDSGRSPGCGGQDLPWSHSDLEDARNSLVIQKSDDPRPQNHQAHEEEMQLPQEWTY